MYGYQYNGKGRGQIYSLFIVSISNKYTSFKPLKKSCVRCIS